MTVSLQIIARVPVPARFRIMRKHASGMG